MDAMFEKADLLRMIKEPLHFQYQRIMAKIMEAIQWTDGDIVLCCVFRAVKTRL